MVEKLKTPDNEMCALNFIGLQCHLPLLPAEATKTAWKKIQGLKSWKLEPWLIMFPRDKPLLRSLSTADLTGH